MDNFSRFTDFISSIFSQASDQKPQASQSGAPYPAIGQGAENIGSHIAIAQTAGTAREDLVEEIEHLLTEYWLEAGGDPRNIANNLQPIVKAALTGLGYLELSKVTPNDVEDDVCDLLKDAAGRIDHFQVLMVCNPVEMIDFAIEEKDAVGICLRRLCNKPK